MVQAAQTQNELIRFDFDDGSIWVNTHNSSNIEFVSKCPTTKRGQSFVRTMMKFWIESRPLDPVLRLIKFRELAEKLKKDFSSST